MLSRRHIRIKVLQILYAFFHSQSDDVLKCERELDKSMDEAHALYTHLLLLLVRLKSLVEQKIELGKNKMLPSQEDLNPNTRFIDNKVLVLLSENLALIEKSKKANVFWDENPELIHKLFRQIIESTLYASYMNAAKTSFVDDRSFISSLFIEFIAPNEDLHSVLEEKSIYWLDDFQIANLGVVKTIKSFKADSDNYTRILPVFKDEDDNE